MEKVLYPKMHPHFKVAHENGSEITVYFRVNYACEGSPGTFDDPPEGSELEFDLFDGSGQEIDPESLSIGLEDIEREIWTYLEEKDI